MQTIKWSKITTKADLKSQSFDGETVVNLHEMRSKGCGVQMKEKKCKTWESSKVYEESDIYLQTYTIIIL